MKKGEEVTINIPFTYTIGEEGFNSGKVLNTVDDCKEEVLAEIENGVLNEEEAYLEAGEPNKHADFLEKLHIMWGENWDLVVEFFGQEVADEWDKLVGYKK